MAYYAALASLVQLLDDIILHSRWPKFLLGRQQVVKSVHEKFSCLEALLQDYSSRANVANDRVEERIRDVAYRAQDIIESKISSQIRSEKATYATENISHHQSSLVGKANFHNLFSRFSTALHRQDTSETYIEDSKMVQQEVDVVVQDLEMVQQEVDLVVQQMMAIKERQRIEGLKLNDGSLDCIGTSAQRPIGKNIMVGFDDYLLTIKDQLCGQSSHLKVVSIVGMGGIGKTTLARNTFEDALILNHFDCHGWSTISQDYHVETILQSIRRSLGMMSNESYGQEVSVLKETIYKHLKGRRYLIVMDDVWGTQILDDVKHAFPDDCNGSRILLTTRLSDVARYATNSDFFHEMQTLDKNQSWNLFRRSVFEEKDCPKELEAIGKIIANKCQGLPLAIVIMARILSKVKTLHDWKKIATDVSSLSSKTDEYLFSVLSLSYNHLPHQLKACFLYMGVFPEDHEIKISTLIKLWIAERFVKSIDESKGVEKIGEECLEDLVARNLVLITKKRPNGQFKYCILHDLLRDFCRQRAFYECFFHVNHKQGYLYPKGVDNVRRISLDFHHLPRGKQPITGKLVRSTFFFGRPDRENLYDFVWDGFELSNVLHSSNIEEWFILAVILQMFHLKYLNLLLAYPRSTLRFPPSLSMLQNLQTLIIHVIGFSIILPSQIWKMTQLRHLIIKPQFLVGVPEVDNNLVQKLGCLQTLMTIRDFRFTDEAVNMIPNLRKLKLECIVYGDNPHGKWESHCLKNLVRLPQLEELNIRIGACDHIPFVNSLSSFLIPPNLRKLSLEGCGVPWKDLTVVGSLPNLQVLKLRCYSFVGIEWEPMEGEFHCLKFLLLEGLDLIYWRAENTHFPCLEHLRIRGCRELKNIPIEIGDIPTLMFIEVFSSSSGAEDSALLIREEQHDLGNDMLQVRVRRW